MKNTQKLILFLAFILVQFPTYAEELSTDAPTLSDGPQTLDAIDESSTTKTDAKTDSTEQIVSEPVTEQIKEEPKVETKTESKKNEVVSEEDLLKPKNPPKPKVVAKKTTESEMYIQEGNKYKISDTFKSLKLNDVIEQGLRKNYDQELRNQNEAYDDLTFESVKRSFWYPSIKLSLTTDSQLISLLRKSNRASAANYPLTPGGTLGLSLGDYTVFNWGKDYAVYLNNKENYERTKQIYSESKRDLKLDLIAKYFELVSTKMIEKIRQDQLRHASFVYRLNKEKITIGKTSQQDYYQARSEYLKAQNDYHEAKMQSDILDENMSFKIADEVGTKYILSEQLEYKRIKLSLEDALDFARKQNPTLLNSKTTIHNAERNLDIAHKENLPLPKFTVNLGAYNKNFGVATNSTKYTTTNGNGNIELVASINATWDLTGEDGLFNNTKLSKSRMNRDISMYELKKNIHYAESMVRETYKNILNYQNQLMILEARIPSVQKTFDTVLENYLSGKARYNDFHIALIDLSETKIALETVRYNHLKEKITLSKMLGIEDFPGENFEHLAQKVKGK
jgi:outer membrane protein TolC